MPMSSPKQSLRRWTIGSIANSIVGLPGATTGKATGGASPGIGAGITDRLPLGARRLCHATPRHRSDGIPKYGEHEAPTTEIGHTGASDCAIIRACRHDGRLSCKTKQGDVTLVDGTLPERIGLRSITLMANEPTIGSPTSGSFTSIVITRCIVPVTRAIDLRSRMIRKCQVRFCSGRRRSNPPPDRNRLLEPPIAVRPTGC